MKRSFLLVLTFALCLGLIVSSAITSAQQSTAATLPNRVASGDTTQTSTVLWARSSVPGQVTFEVSTAPDFSSVVFTTSATVTITLVPAKVQVPNLVPGTNYYYRVTSPTGETDTGRFVTASTPGAFAGLRFGASGDWRGELSPYPSISNADERGLDFFVALGDTIYADYPSPALMKPQAESLRDFRIKHNEVYSTRFGLNTLGDLRASTSILATIDDHEVTNDFAGGAHPSTDPRFANFPGSFINDTPLYERGLQAFQEYNPLRNEFYGNTGDPRTAGERKLYRYRTYGQDAAVFVLDARSFRDQELTPANPTDPNDIARFIIQSFDPTRTMLGAQQLADLKNDLQQAENNGIMWKFVMVPEPIQNLGVVGAADRFEGYAAERTEILRFINQQGIRNVVFVAADVHGTVVNNLTYQDVPFGPQIPTQAFEITTGAVAFDAPFGPTVVNLAELFGIISPAVRAFYDSLPVANDPDSVVNDKDDFVKQLVDSQIIQFGYDPVGLNGSGIPAELQQGDYIAVHTYGWTEFRVNRQTQRLRITTFGIEPYTEAELLADPQSIISRVPFVVSQFSVNPR